MPTKPSSSEILDTRQLLKVLTALKKGDQSVRMPLEQTGVAGKIADALNDILDRHDEMGKELARISKVVGKDGKTAQRSSLAAAGGFWSGYTDSVNTLIDDLIHPATEVTRVIETLAKGDLTQKVALEIEGVPLKGLFLQNAKTVNNLVDRLDVFSSEVTRVALEVGVEGQLGAQATVKGVSGTWKGCGSAIERRGGMGTSACAERGKKYKSLCQKYLYKEAPHRI